MGIEGKRELWLRRLLPLGLTLIINCALCVALVRLSATPPAPENRIAVELEGVRPVPPPPPPKPLLQRLLMPKLPIPSIIGQQRNQSVPQLAVKAPRPTLFRRLQNIFTPAPQPVVRPPTAIEPQQRDLPQEPQKAVSVPAPISPPVMSPIEPARTAETDTPATVQPSATAPEHYGGEGGGSGDNPGGPPAGTGAGTGAGSGDGRGDGNAAPSSGGQGSGGVSGVDTHGSGPGIVFSPGNGHENGEETGSTRKQGSGGGNAPEPGTGKGSGGNDSGTSSSAPRGITREPQAIVHPEPKYPQAAADEGLEGTVRLEVSLDANGKLLKAKVLRSSGYRILDRAALDEVKTNWLFEPRMDDGIAVPSTFTVRVEFKL